MTYQVVNLPLPDSTNSHRQFYTVLNDAYLKHIDCDKEKVPAIDVVVVHDNKEVQAGVIKDIQKAGNKYPYTTKQIPNPQQDLHLNQDIFLLYDDTGTNYAHFWFDFFGKCLYFDELRKENPNLKLGILEKFYQEEGNSTFIKQWLDLYYQDQDIDIIVLKQDTQYKIKQLILPNCYYWFPEDKGEDFIVKKIVETCSKIPPLQTSSKGCYISRQDTIKRGWYHKRNLINETDLITNIQNELGYDIVELMDYDIIGKIQIFKSYPIIIQQSSASNIGILFSNQNNTHVIISNPRMAPWLNYKISQLSEKTLANLIIIDDAGEYLSEDVIPGTDKGNYPWELTNIEGLIELFKQIDTNLIWNL